MLQKLGVPGTLQLSTVLPVYKEFRYQIAGKTGLYIGHHQNIKHICAGLPSFGYLVGFTVSFDSGRKPLPLASNVLHKL